MFSPQKSGELVSSWVRGPDIPISVTQTGSEDGYPRDPTHGPAKPLCP